MLRQDTSDFCSGSAAYIRCTNCFPRLPGLIVDQAWSEQLVPEVVKSVVGLYESAAGPIS